MTLKEYRNYLKEMDNICDKVRFVAWYSHEMYPFNLYYVCGKFTYKELFLILKDLVKHKSSADDIEHFDILIKGILKYEGTCYSRRDTDFIMRVPTIQYSPKGMSRIVHEAQHGTIQLSLEIGNELSWEGQEAWCYLIDDIVEKYFIFQHDAIERFLKSPKTTDYLTLTK
jgi:hypothetical protein